MNGGLRSETKKRFGLASAMYCRYNDTFVDDNLNYTRKQRSDVLHGSEAGKELVKCIDSLQG